MSTSIKQHLPTPVYTTSEKGKGWVNLYQTLGGLLIVSKVYTSEEAAKLIAQYPMPNKDYVDTVSIEWKPLKRD
jgi:hypothetical protein